jgi:predicted lipoprotein
LNKYIKYGLLLLVIVLLAYKSVYFEKLSTRKSNAAVSFDAVGFSKKLWEEKMPAKLDSAIDLSQLITAIDKESETAINKYTNALAIGNYRYALVKLDAIVMDVKKDEVMLLMKHNDSLIIVNLATEFIYGNAIRDASGLVQVKDFPNTADLNGISEELNKIIRTSVLPAFKTSVKIGDKINVVAAVELNKEHIHWGNIELLPVRIQEVN